MQQCNWLHASHRGGKASALDSFTHRRHANVLSSRGEVSPTNHFDASGCVWTRPPDLRSILAVGHDAAAIWVNTRRQCCAIHFGGTDIDRVMVIEERAVLREFVELWRVLGADKVRAHSVPDDEHHVFSFAL